jgi:hypothetical protein
MSRDDLAHVDAASGLAIAAASAAMHPPVAEPVAGPYPVPPPERSAGPIRPNRAPLSGRSRGPPCNPSVSSVISLLLWQKRG